MDKRIITVSILGCGSRGCHSYGTIMNSLPEKYKIVSLCDLKQERIDLASKLFNVPKENCFDNDDDFFKEKRSELLIIATLDNDHVKLAIEACKLGYKILLEKPISPKKEELNELSKVAKKYNSFIMVCHVLRYTWSNRVIMDLLNRKTMGTLVQIDHTEQIGYWHYGHSYVRGNWRNNKVSAPMIMAKSCHDLDLLQEYANSKVESLSSYGKLFFFKKENQPEGAADRCLQCKYVETCPYSAKHEYIDKWHSYGDPQCWPFNVLSSEYLTEDVLMKCIETGPYGRCVFASDNDVADNQSVSIKFENGVQATFRASAFTGHVGRITIFNCTYGQIIYEEEKGTIIERPFGKDDIVHTYDASKDEFGHGGGDTGLVSYLYEALTNENANVDTSLDNSIESHLMAIAAEDSRLAGGKTVYLKDYR